MPAAYAPTPKNSWSLKVPAAAWGAAQLPIPQPATVGEANSEGYRQKLLAAITAQIDANAEAREAQKQEEHSRPFGQPAPTPPAASRPGAALPTAAQPKPMPTASAQPAPDGGRYVPAGASWPSPAEALAASKAEPQGYRWPSASGLDGAPTMADRARARHGLPPAAASNPSPEPQPTAGPTPPGPGPGASIADHMKARCTTATAEPSGAAREPTIAEKIAARLGVSLDARREPEPAPAAMLPSRSDR